MSKLKDLSNQRFGKLTVINRSGSTKRGRATWLCKCDCGNETIVQSTDLLSGHTKSCGCFKFESRNKTHGMRHTRLYNTWCNMKRRCNNPSSQEYKYYGAKGIHLCADWNNGFVSFMNWAYANGYNDSLTIERIDYNKDYCPNNCKWIPFNEQSKNKRNNRFITYKGKTQILADWCRELNLDYDFIEKRMSVNGFTFEQAINVPKFHRKDSYCGE